MTKLLESNVIGGGVKRDYYRSPKATQPSVHWGHAGGYSVYYINHNLDTRHLEIIPIVKVGNGGWPSNSTVGACCEAQDGWQDYNNSIYGGSQGWWATVQSKDQVKIDIRTTVGGQLIFDVFRISPEEDPA